ncbi:hypothetical protein YC2023_097206 [Brassica napus]
MWVSNSWKEQLSKLHSDAPQHSFAYTKKTIERAFGRKLSEVFEEAPLASGSIAQNSTLNLVIVEGEAPSPDSRKRSPGASDNDESSESSTASEEGSDGSDSEQEGGIVVSSGDPALDSYVLARDRSRRKNVRPPSRFDDANLVAYALSVAEEIEIEEPKTYAEAMRTKERKFRNAAAEEEMVSLKKNRTWDLIDKPKDLKPVGCRWIFKLKPDRKEGVLRLSQAKYLEKVLKTFGMFEARSVVTPTASHFKLKSLHPKERDEEYEYMKDVPYASAVGSLMYAMVGSRPDLGFAVGLISRFMSHPSRAHWEAVKWVLRYVAGNYEKCLVFKKSTEFRVEGFSDSDYSADLDKRRSLELFFEQAELSYKLMSFGGATRELSRGV